MRHKTPARTAFTLVELLVVVAILALLIAILLPSLKKAQYVAKVVVCQSNQRQLAIGLLTYTTEYENYYPSDGHTRTNGRPWDQAMTTLASNYLEVDVRPLIRPYWTSQQGERTPLEQCPLAPELESTDQIWRSGTVDRFTSYLFYFNFSGAYYAQPPFGQPMQRAGDLFKPVATDDWGVQTLISDVAAEHQTNYQRFSNHHALNPAYAPHTHWYFQRAYRTPVGSPAATSANFARQDGSVSEHTMAANGLDGLTRLHKASNHALQVVPTEHVVYD